MPHLQHEVQIVGSSPIRSMGVYHHTDNVVPLVTSTWCRRQPLALIFPPKAFLQQRASQAHGQIQGVLFVFSVKQRLNFAEVRVAIFSQYAYALLRMRFGPEGGVFGVKVC